MILRRTLCGASVDGCEVLDVQAGAPGADGSRTVRLFLGRGTAPEAVIARDGIVPRQVVVLGGSLVVLADWDGEGDRVPFPVAGREARLDWAAPEPELLAGRDVLMATRNGEDAGLVEEWLSYHVARHGAQGAVILDRRRPGEAPLALDAAPCPVIVVDSPRPLGLEEPSERSAQMAPDAPGRDRMTARPADPWTARLGQLSVLEALRWRFLSRARGVAWLDVSDLLAPGADLFARLARAPSGVVALEGRRVYPWRVRRDAAPGFGDHVCAPFENAGVNRRWAAAPARLPDAAAFRLVRVGKIAPDPGPPVPFLRAMAARHHEAGDAALAPRAGLRRDDDLVALAREMGHDPILPPEVDAEALAPRLPAALPGRTAIVTCMRNEGPYVLDWLAHHRAIGVDDVLVYTNDCTDGTDRLLDLLQSHDIVQHRANPFRGTGLKPQHAALAAAEEEGIVARAGWVASMDVDEFLCIHVGGGTLADLYGAVGDANMISATWRLFGSADLAAYEDMPVPARFDRCAARMSPKPHQAWGLKTLARNLGLYRKLGVHRPRGLNAEAWDRVTWVNGSGAPMPVEMLRSGWRSTTETVGYDLVTLNHYAVRDAESFLVKRDRGRVNHVDRDQGLGYWFRMNNNAERDTAMHRALPAMLAEAQALKALPGVADQHAACVAAHRARIAELRTRLDYDTLYRTLTSERMRRLSRMHRHFGANVFLAGPDAVPDAVAFGAHDDEFFFTVEGRAETAH